MQKLTMFPLPVFASCEQRRIWSGVSGNPLWVSSLVRPGRKTRGALSIWKRAFFYLYIYLAIFDLLSPILIIRYTTSKSARSLPSTDRFDSSSAMNAAINFLIHFLKVRLVFRNGSHETYSN